MKHIKASNWVAETATPTSTGFLLSGTSKGYATFSSAFSSGQDVFYSAHDDSGNREAGYARFDGTSLVDRQPTATLIGGVYKGTVPPLVNFIGDVTLACTFNASAFNLMFESLQTLDPDGDGGINIPPDLIDGLGEALSSKAEQADLEKEIADRKAGDEGLQAQIDALDPDGDRTVDWDEIEGKPSTFPPATHNHDGEYLKDETDPTVPDYVKAITQDDIDGWNAGGSGGASTWDELTGKPTEFPPEAHTHEQSEVDGLEDRLESIEDSITSGGGFVDAPDDGKLYGRQSEAWAEVVFPEESGAGMVISDTEPSDPVDGMQWMDATTAIVWVWDEDKWLEFPAGKGGDSGNTYTLPVAVRGGDIQLPLNEDSTKLIVDTRSGPVELPLMAA